MKRFKSSSELSRADDVDEIQHIWGFFCSEVNIIIHINTYAYVSLEHSYHLIDYNFIPTYAIWLSLCHTSTEESSGKIIYSIKTALKRYINNYN